MLSLWLVLVGEGPASAIWALAWASAHGGKSGVGRRFGEGEQAQAGKGVSWYQEGARERVVAVAASLGGR